MHMDSFKIVKNSKLHPNISSMVHSTIPRPFIQSLQRRSNSDETLSPSNKAGLALTLIGASLLIIVISMFVFLRRKYGPRYTIWSFITGTRPQQTRSPRDLTTPDIMDSLVPRYSAPEKRSQNAAHARAPGPAPVSRPVSDARTDQKSTHTIQIGLDTKPPAMDPVPPYTPLQPVPKARTREKSATRLDQKSVASTALSIDIEAITKQYKALLPPPPSPSTSRTPANNRLSIETRSSGPLPSSFLRPGLESCDASDRVISLPSPSPLFKNKHPSSAIPPTPKPRFIYSMQNRSIQPSLSHRVMASDLSPPILPQSTFAVTAPSYSPFPHQAQNQSQNVERAGDGSQQESERERSDRLSTPSIFRQHPGEEVHFSEERRLRSPSLDVVTRRENGSL